ncbi:MAG TPA: FecR domain-containing protein [Cyclobacteriaceae bacterium]|nr:FecR domain-containing protein [Cyclobacteriaceae bacterium]
MKEELLIKYLLGESSDQENLQVEAWLQEHPDHRKEYEQMAWAWDKSKILLHEGQVDENEAWESFKNRRGRSGKIKFFSPWTRAVAAVFVLMLAGIIVLSFLPHGGRAYFAEVMLEAGGSSKKELLLDGTIVTLNKQAKLSYRQKLFGHEREAKLLQGEAYFEVKKDVARPFLVQAGEVKVEVLGTSFNVQRDGEQTHVILDQGSVAVTWEGQELLLKPGQKVLANLTTKQLEVLQADNQLHRYYVNNKFEAQQVPLLQIIEALNRAYDAQITIGSENLSQTRLTTTLEYGSLDQNLEVIKETLGLRISGEGKNRILY